MMLAEQSAWPDVILYLGLAWSFVAFIYVVVRYDK